MPLEATLPPPIHPLTGEEVGGGGLQAGTAPPHLLHLKLHLPHQFILVIQAPEEEAVKAHLGVVGDEDRNGGQDD